jgi:hypothetical protein
MATLVVNIIFLLLSVAVIGIAAKKWHIIRDRRQILSVIKNALKERKALISGIIIALFYLTVFVILGGKGGRIHVLFGRVIWNTTPLEMLTGVLLAILVMISMALFVFGVRVIGAKQSGKEGGMGFFGSLLALVAAFCP